MAPFHQNAQTLVLTSGRSGVGVGPKVVANTFQNCDVLFWYDINGRILVNRLTANASTIWDALSRGRTNGALVMVYREREQNVTHESDSGEMRDFVVELLPVLRNYLP
jgi:Protein of unknown function (DUF3485)